MNLKQIFRLVLSPLKDLSYFEQYFCIVEQIVLFKNRKFLLILTLVNIVLGLKAVHFAYLTFCSTVTAVENAVHFDVYYLMMSKQQLNLASMFSALMVLYFNRILFSKVNYRLLVLVKSILFESQWTHFFLTSKYRSRGVCVRVRKCFLLTLNLSISLIVTLEFIMLYCYLYFVYSFWKHSDYFWGKSFLFLVLCIGMSHFSAFGVGLYMVNFAHAVALNFASTAALLAMFFIKIQQVYDFLVKRVLPKGMFNPISYVRYRRMFTQTLIVFFATNRMYGRLFCVFLVTFVPIDILFTMWIIEGSMMAESKAILYFWIGYLAYLNFVLHLIFAYCTKRIHRPSKALIRMMVRNSRNIPLRTQIHLALDLRVALPEAIWFYLWRLWFGFD